MDQQKVEMMRQNYAAMNDDELIWIAATRMATLTDEARVALQETIRLRKLGDADAAVAEVRHELAQQHAAAMRDAERKSEIQRQMRRLMRWSLVVCLVLGAIAMVLDDDLGRGLLIIGIPLLFYLWYEIKRFGWNLILAMFRND